MNKTIIFIILIALIVASYFIFFNKKATVGEQAPAVSGTLINGQEFSLEDLKGKTVYLVFWGSWCPPCRAELPHWVAFYNDLNKEDSDIEVVSIAVEKKEGASKRVAEALNFPWKYQLEEVSGITAMNEFSQMYGVTEIPAAFLIKPDGTLAGKVEGVPHK